MRGLDPDVHAGEVVAILGLNGAGKTTTLLTLAGILPPISGTVTVWASRCMPDGPPDGPARAGARASRWTWPTGRTCSTAASCGSRLRPQSSAVVICGTHTGEFLGIAATGRTIEIETVDVLRVVNGKITEHWGVADLLKMMMQLGVVDL